MKVIAVFPQGLEMEGAKELSLHGAQQVKLRRGLVEFQSDMACLYRLHLQARLPFRFLREVARFPCSDPRTLYLGIQRALDWHSWLPPSLSFRVDVSGSTSRLNHSHFSALQVKNALVDFQRQCWGKRSDVNLGDPDLCFHLHLNNGAAILSLDGVSGSLHRRGYRAAMGVAPIKENLAAGLIGMTSWESSLPLVDPLCGSGTFLIEAASLALQILPSKNRTFLLKNWADFDSRLWEKELQLAAPPENKKINMPLIIGCEADEEIARQANANVCAAGLQKVIHIKIGDFEDLRMPDKKGVIVCNPPYGKRIGRDTDLSHLYIKLGQFLKTKASGWDFWMLSGNPSLSAFLKMKCNSRIPINNGGIDCRWLHYAIH
ncbi:class I SAM-dependent RNA methyltransferase [Prochlorococcus sp. MIT 1300]|uniref:THUMP domain-containing class I SAM-dependent RNA methyltransferase n=1 Tax=Prochlorococcus sp. MIT 1300 TaxID=3096218 RepID=UPI002A75AF52|nr:class I SAM-dependent RNA methyltransferase [Prochlorococcus sp. MIT 1300]